MPGVLLLEAMSALAAAASGAGTWRLRRAESLRFRHFVVPGDQLEITVEALGADRWRGRVCVEGRPVATVRTLSLAAAHDVPTTEVADE
jgi:3-hydroxyacyl-[acyl-carrier-protein] dehydratase